METTADKIPFLEKLFADSAYQGPKFGDALTKILPLLETEIVKRPNSAKGWENLNRNALAFLKLASIRSMLRKLCNP